MNYAPPLQPPVYQGSPNDYLGFIQNLTKQYQKNTWALNQLNFAFSPGQILGLLGPNGCGKTTLFRILAGVDQVYSGEVRIAGLPPGIETKANVSYLPDQPGIGNGTRFSQAIEFNQDFYADFDRNHALELAKSFQIPLDQKYGQLSKGFKERFQIALTMARHCPLYILDEPLSGVDPAARLHILNVLLSSFDERSTMLISTHLVHDIEPVISHVAFMHQGQIRAHREAEDLRSEQGKSLNQIFQEVYYAG